MPAYTVSNRQHQKSIRPAPRRVFHLDTTMPHIIVIPVNEALMQLGTENIMLAAKAEQAEFLEQQLEASDTRILELEATITVLRLPSTSQEAVIQMVREGA